MQTVRATAMTVLTMTVRAMTVRAMTVQVPANSES
jgi:hypothetical protein